MKIVFEGHACFRLLSGSTEIVIDPFISNNPQCTKSVDQFEPDLILVTHGHSDHLGDALTVAKKSQATLAAQADLLRALDCHGLNTVSFNLGGTFRFNNIDVTMVPAWHGNTVATAEGDKYAGLACGYIIDDGQYKVYHAGDTCLFGDMATVISRYELDCAMLPVGDYYTMGPIDAVTAAHWLKAPLIIPMHYNTFPVITQDIEEFKKDLENKTESKGIILAPGEHYQLG